MTAGPVAGVEGGGLVLHGQLQFQLNQDLTLIPALHTAAHEAECGVRQSLTEDAYASMLPAAAGLQPGQPAGSE